jgi:hypothetical protein
MRRQPLQLFHELSGGGDVGPERFGVIVRRAERLQFGLDVGQDGQRLSGRSAMRPARLRHKLVHLRAQAGVQMVEIILDGVRRRALLTHLEMPERDVELAPPLVRAHESGRQCHQNLRFANGRFPYSAACSCRSACSSLDATAGADSRQAIRSRALSAICQMAQPPECPALWPSPCLR